MQSGGGLAVMAPRGEIRLVCSVALSCRPRHCSPMHGAPTEAGQTKETVPLRPILLRVGSTATRTGSSQDGRQATAR